MLLLLIYWFQIWKKCENWNVEGWQEEGKQSTKRVKRNLNKNVYCRDDLVTFILYFFERNDIAVWFKERLKRRYMGARRNSHEPVALAWHLWAKKRAQRQMIHFRSSCLNNSLTMFRLFADVCSGPASIARWWWIIDFWIFITQERSETKI